MSDSPAVSPGRRSAADGRRPGRPARAASPADPADLLRLPLADLKGIGRKRDEDLARAGLRRVEDLLCRFPLRYVDRSRFCPIGEARVGAAVTLAGEIVGAAVIGTRRPGYRLCRATLRDASGHIELLWPNQIYLVQTLRSHRCAVVYGVVRQYRDRRQIVSPQLESIDDDRGGPSVHVGRIVPIYERAGSMTPKMQRSIVHALIERLPDSLPDPLPADLLDRHGWPGRRDAFRTVHFPPADGAIDELNRFRAPAQVRMIVEEFFLFHLGVALARQRSGSQVKPFAVAVDDRVREAARRALPFRLTPGQREALREIVTDMCSPSPMNRLLQGDVGSGKTIVALIAAVVAMENGLQVAFMAPTELLAEQHFATIGRILGEGARRVDLLTSATSPAARRRVASALESGEPRLVVGTHALVQESVRFRSLGLAIIDEQHRFGVMQRARLRDKGSRPDVLVMTATPIPRTLALTLYGDLDVSAIRDLPPGRSPVETVAVPEDERAAVYREAAGEIRRGRQVYIVFPLVEDSEKVDVRAATAMADHLAQDVFPAFRVGLVHGRMPADARDRVMRRFAAGDVDVLVATTVIEVGIDVPNASMVIVDHAERFGLAQLHQIRGRVGRGAHRSRAVLVYRRPLGDDARARLDALVATTDGFAIAERDLALRGPGDLSGHRQAGMPTLRIGDLVRDADLLDLARREAVDRVRTGRVDDAALADALRAWTERFGLVAVG